MLVGVVAERFVLTPSDEAGQEPAAEQVRALRVCCTSPGKPVLARSVPALRRQLDRDS
jgi:hypothetical protein